MILIRRAIRRYQEFSQDCWLVGRHIKLANSSRASVNHTDQWAWFGLLNCDLLAASPACSSEKLGTIYG